MSHNVFWKQLIIIQPTYNTLCKGGSHESGQPQVTYLDWARGTSNEDVITLEISVDNRRGPGVKEVESFQNLSTPAPQDLGFHLLKALQISIREKKTHLKKYNIVLVLSRNTFYHHENNYFYMSVTKVLIMIATEVQQLFAQDCCKSVRQIKLLHAVGCFLELLCLIGKTGNFFPRVYGCNFRKK